MNQDQEKKNMNTFCQVPPGFRFHPTDEELVDYYLRRKVSSRRIDLDVIKDVDLYKIEPWDLQELCRIGSEEQNEWYFFSHKDKKYPTGTRTNRATTAGFWKATGRDKAIYSKHDLVGMRKTLVFYKGRAPNGQKSDWIMHEYRMETDENGAPQEEGWVVCRVFKKRLANVRKFSEHDSPIWYDDHVPFMPEMDSPNQTSQNNVVYSHHHYPYTSCKKEMSLQYGGGMVQPDHFIQMPFLESAKMQPDFGPGPGPELEINHMQGLDHSLSSVVRNNAEMCDDRVTDWRVLDKFVASQLSHEEITKENDAFNDAQNVNLMDNTSTSSSMWK